MLRLAKNLNGFKLGARDGEIGKVRDFYFDDQSWAVRYLIADTGSWLSDRQVLIPPHALEPADENAMIIPAALTRAQIENSPPLESQKPVSRQFEMQYYPYFGWPEYWVGTDAMLGNGYPVALDPIPTLPAKENDPHLRSTADVSGYAIDAQDGEIGHVKDFVIDDETWVIRYLVVDTQNWWPGKKVLISTSWIDRISWAESKVVVHMTRESIKAATEYTDDALITRDYETHLHGHYKRSGYWETESYKGR